MKVVFLVYSLSMCSVKFVSTNFFKNLESLTDGCGMIIVHDSSHSFHQLTSILSEISTHSKGVFILKWTHDVFRSRSWSPSPHGKGHMCSFAVLFMEKFQSQSSMKDNLNSYLTDFLSETHPSRAFFIFNVSPSQVELLGTLPEPRIKFKIALTVIPSKTEYHSRVYSFDANGKAISMKLDSSNVTTLFPDYIDRDSSNGKVLRITTPVLAAWLSELKTTESGAWDLKRSISAQLVPHLIRRFNFTVEYFPSDGGGTGKLVNGSWTGAVGDVVNGRAHMTSHMATTFQRSLFVDVTRVYYYNKFAFYVAKPQIYYSWKSVYRPLSPLLWLLVFLSVLVVSSTLWVSVILTEDEKNNRFLKFLVFSLEGLVEKDSGKLIRCKLSDVVRSVVAIWLLVCLILLTAYRSKLMSAIMFPEFRFVPRTYEELGNSNFRCIMYYIKGIAYTYIMASTNPAIGQVRSRMELETDSIKCFQAVLGGGASCLAWYDVGDYVGNLYFADKFGRTPFLQSEDYKFPSIGGFLVQRHAVFLPNFDKVIAQATDFGLFQKWADMDKDFIRNMGKGNRKTSFNQEQTHQQSLLLINLSGAFFLLGFGLFFSILTFCVTEIGKRLVLQVMKYTIKLKYFLSVLL